MSITHRVKRLLGASLAGAMVLALMPAGIAAAQTIDTADVEACGGSEGLIEFNDNLGFFGPEIECMAAFGITVGDAEGNFNTAATTPRQQMALFIARFVAQAQTGTTNIPEATDDAFEDIANINPPEARDAINWLAELGITTGVTEDTFDPAGTVTRQQMASFFVRAHTHLTADLPAPSDPDVFTDTDDIADVHRVNVLTLHAAGVVEGRADGSYGPAAAVTRGQMSAFVVRSIGVLEAQGLWNGVFVVEPPVDPVGTFEVTPADAATIATGQSRTYTVTGVEVGTNLDIRLVAPATIRSDGTFVLDATGALGNRNALLAAAGGATTITQINGVSVADGPTQTHTATGSTVTFTVAQGADTETAVPVVSASPTTALDDLPVNLAGEAKVRVGIGGQVTFSAPVTPPAEAASAPIPNEPVDLLVGSTGFSVNTVAGQYIMRDHDNYQLGGNPITKAQFQSILGVGDAMAGVYVNGSTPANPSTFNIVTDLVGTAAAPTVTSVGSDVTVTWTPQAEATPNGTVFELRRQPVVGGVAGSVTVVWTGTVDTLAAQTFNETLADGVYRYTVRAVPPAFSGTASTTSGETVHTVSTTTVVVAPEVLRLFLTSNPTNINNLNEGDVFKVVTNSPITQVTDSATLTVGGTVLTNGGNATFSLNTSAEIVDGVSHAAGRVLTVTITDGTPTVSVPFGAGTTLTTSAGISNSAGLLDTSARALTRDVVS